MSTQWPQGWDAGWRNVGATSMTDYFVDDEGVLLALPELGSQDTHATALENLAFQKAHFDGCDDPAVIAIFFERMVSQDRAARKAYSSDASLQWSYGFALIGGSTLARAMGSFFLGLSRPQAPTKMFATLADARSWLRERQEEARRS